MKVTISQRQFSFVIANLTISTSLMVLPQSMIDLAMENAWIVPIMIFIIASMIIHFAFIGIEKLNQLALDPDSFKTKVLAVIMMILITHIITRDVRVMSGFIETTLLPTTPTFIIIVMLIGTSLYLAWAGIEVIARFNEMVFVIFIGVILFIPLSLIGDIKLENFEPVLGLKTIPSLLQSSYITLAWIGEMVVILLLFGSVKTVKEAKVSSIFGVGIGLFTLFILIFMEIAVLGAEIVRYSTYPTYVLVQQIRLTEFLDRLDFILIGLYFPTVFAKFALLLYGLNRSVNLLTNTQGKITLMPLAILMGILSITMFENKSALYNFKIHTWATLGLILEGMIILIMLFVVWNKRKGRKKSKVEADG